MEKIDFQYFRVFIQKTYELLKYCLQKILIIRFIVDYICFSIATLIKVLENN